MTAPLHLSALDLVPVRSGQTSAQAVAASMRLATLADGLGFTRYWFAEHHNMPAVASTTPPVLIAAAAARTERIRVGSGGVMLPNHSPLVVAEQFAALEALAPGRIDLGLGRAPGSDGVITQLLRMSGTTSDVDRFGDHVADIAALVQPDGATLRLTSGREYAVHATPGHPAPRRSGCWGRATSRRASRPSSDCPTSSRTTSRARASSARSSSTARATGRARRTPSRARSSR
ncbi:hypothetical protein GCM10025877_11240 [Agromyces mangrovi Wang et al. 2018]|nr:hypothetical protein GCM10025877_11240 [Agromyces mangrovi]